MHSHSLDDWTHDHLFDQHRKRAGERATRIVVVLTFTFMAVEIGAGLAFGSMALLADGLHMGSHALALGIAAFAYAYARRFAGDQRYSFGTGKVNALGGFAGALLLFVFAGWMAIESVARAVSPVSIAFDQALAVAVLGLAVNVLSAWLLSGGGHDHHGHDHHAHDHHTHDHHDHGHHHAHDGSHGDLNLRSAYLHVIADALTSVLAILALLGGRQFGWTWLDPVMGLVGAVLVARWAVGLIRSSASVLLDAQAPDKVVEPLRAALEQDGDKLADLHVWRVAPEAYAAIVSIVTDAPASPETYRARIPHGLGIRHASIEVNACPHGHGG